MPFFQMKKIMSMVKMLGFLFAIFIFAGCVAQNAETAKTAEQDQATSTEMAAGTGVGEERQINQVSVEETDRGIDVTIQGNQKLVYTSIKQAFPFGIAVYLPETRLAENLMVTKADIPDISDLIVEYADKEKTTAKVEILLNKDLNYEVKEGNQLLTVALLDNMAPVQSAENAPAETPAMAEAGSSDMSSASGAPVVIPKTRATMTNIEFNTMEDGKSDIVVETSHPVNYDITQGGKDSLYLNLFNTAIPDYHLRPLLTHYFKSAVESLMPLSGQSKDARIEIKMRDKVPYRVVRNQNTISVFFDPSRIEPPLFTKAVKKVASGVQYAEMAEQSAEPSVSVAAAPMEKTPTAAEKAKSMEEQIYGVQKVYTGEKIKLDFYETDIKNVFRILRSVGGLNFAIDKNVEGKVTLTLEDPVPWDQVLDLVLKMNNLGQKTEGNVIRIATLDTLQKEDKQLQETIAARKKALEQKKSLEPLVTEYIPINYSDAEGDIKPHLEQILTADRGKISVDKRTNMVIVTDTQAKIDQAKEIIYRLDQVTPQIMIEAKVVEVTKDFSRELGMGLTLSERTTPTAGAQDFSVALNNPIAAPITAGSFNFFRLLGSSTTQLNVQLAASETKGDVKVVSSPRILTLDNKSAKIKQGLEYAYLERDDTGGSSVKFKNIDLLLEVTPHVTPDKRIAMNVYLTKNDIDSITNGVPSLSTNEAETELLVNDNDTIVIGGIVKTTDNESSSGTPFLSGIPILGRLFRTDINTDKRNELLIFLTPSIVQLDQKRNAFTRND